MKLTTRGRYSTRLMMELALNYEKRLVLLKDVASSQEISQKYLSQLIIPLKIAGLVRSSRGAHGGYCLSRAPKDIKLIEIITAVEGPFYLVECVVNPDICNRSKSCVAREVWSEIGEKFLDILSSYNLQQLTERHIEKHLRIN
ncbi:MAG: Rrf2 family transcriptional regulator [Actinobacteria bacterium]|nr:Rrf2 family transcriptional regulator [Actinomycetota bacterium]